MNDFETLERFGQELEAKWLETAINNDSNNKTFKGIQRLLQGMNLFLENERKDVEAEYQKLLENQKYTPKFIGEKRKELSKRYDENVKAMVAGTRATIKELIAEKFKRLDSMLVEAPTPEQTALLQTLQMRTGNLSTGELMKILPYFFRNYQAMRVLESIAETAGKTIVIPLDGDVMDMYGLLDRAGEYLLGAADQLAERGNVRYKYRAFFYFEPDSPGNADPIYQQFIDAFDIPAQLQDYTVTDALSPAEYAKVKALFSRIENLDPTKGADNLTILRETQQIMREHPDDLEMIKRSEYGKYVYEVLEIDRINSEKAAADGEEREQAASNG